MHKKNKVGLEKTSISRTTFSKSAAYAYIQYGAVRKIKKCCIPVVPRKVMNLLAKSFCLAQPDLAMCKDLECSVKCNWGMYPHQLDLPYGVSSMAEWASCAVARGIEVCFQ
jgi:hypothetical protein